MELSENIVMWARNSIRFGNSSPYLEAGHISYETDKTFKLCSSWALCIWPVNAHKETNKQTPWLVVRKRTIPTERSPFVGEVSVNFCG
jgi:hypothetical protein